MKQATLTDDGFHQWVAEYDDKKFSIWLSYLWDANGNWHYYYVVTDYETDLYYRVQARDKSLTPEYEAKLCKKAMAYYKKKATS